MTSRLESPYLVISRDLERDGVSELEMPSRLKPSDNAVANGDPAIEWCVLCTLRHENRCIEVGYGIRGAELG